MPSGDGGALERFYQFLWPDADSNAARFVILDEELPASSDEPMLAAVLRHGLAPGALVLDAGSGKGKQAVRLARELGARVLAVDVRAGNAAMTAARAAGEGLGGSILAVRGELAALPVRDGAVDLVWCRDTLNHLADPRAVVREWARVLGPGGRAINCSAIATPWLHPGELAAVATPMAIAPATLDAAAREADFAAAGLTVVEAGDTTDATSPFYEALGTGEARDAMRHARLVRDEARLRAALGDDTYDHLLAYYRWNGFLLTGKIRYRTWVLAKETR